MSLEKEQRKGIDSGSVLKYTFYFSRGLQKLNKHSEKDKVHRETASMTCPTFLKDLYGAPPFLIALIRTYNILIGVMNIIGNAILIWALRRTGQTTSLSLQFIIIMSSSDITGGIISLVFTTLLLAGLNYCRLKLTIQFTLNTCNFFSICMIFLIALDRYLHMKYLERYPLVFTKKRGYSVAAIMLLTGISTSAVSVSPFSKFVRSILQIVYFSISIFFLMAIAMLYHEALCTLKRKSCGITRSIVNQNIALGKAGKRVSICVLVLIVPLCAVLLLEAVNYHLEFVNASVLIPVVWFAFITLLGNGFCSSVIFMSQNIPIKRLLRRTLRYNLNRIQAAFRKSEGNP